MDALAHFPWPLSKRDVRSFCGLVQQFEALTTDITSLMRPITELLSSKAAFQWLPTQEELSGTSSTSCKAQECSPSTDQVQG